MLASSRRRRRTNDLVRYRTAALDAAADKTAALLEDWTPAAAAMGDALTSDRFV